MKNLKQERERERGNREKYILNTVHVSHITILQSYIIIGYLIMKLEEAKFAKTFQLEVQS